MWPRTGPPQNTPPAPPSSVISEDGGGGGSRQSMIEMGTPNDSIMLDTLLAKGPLDIDLLSELLGSLDDTAASTVASTPNLNITSMAEADAMTVSAGVETAGDGACDSTDFGSITTEAVLDGLRSLDEFERQAAVHTEGRIHDEMDDIHALRGIGNEDIADSMLGATPQSASIPGSHAGGLSALDLGVASVDETNTGLVSFNEAELSAALEQIYWGSLDMPLVDPADMTARSTDLGEHAFLLPAPTPAPTPMTATQTPQTRPADIAANAWTLAGSISPRARESSPSDKDMGNSYDGAGGHESGSAGGFTHGGNDEYEDEDEEDDGDDNPLELEELSLFSLFLSDMKAFEGFLDNLSLNQLRQCAATVNSVLVRRESALNDPVKPARYMTKSRSASRLEGRLQNGGRASVGAGGSPDISSGAAYAGPTHDYGDGGATGAGHRSASTADVQRSANAAFDPESRAADTDPSTAGSSAAPLPPTTLSLLREWLPPSTADCVITALQAANLAIPAASNASTSTSATSMAASFAGVRSNRVWPNATASLANSPGGAASSADMDDSEHDVSRAGRAGSSGEAKRHASDFTLADPAHANEPSLETDDEGTPWLSFIYAQKGKPRRHRIRIDIDRAPLSAIPATFQKNNCVYPRANCERSIYAGNRWSYETECNGLGWKLSFLNQELLSGRRGLLQTAVNNYRTMVAGRKSRRITRLEKAERNQHNKPSGDPQQQRSTAKAAEGTSKRPLSSACQPAAAHQCSTTPNNDLDQDAMESGSVPYGKRAKTMHSALDGDAGCSSAVVARASNSTSDTVHMSRGVRLGEASEIARAHSLPQLEAAASSHGDKGAAALDASHPPDAAACGAGTASTSAVSRAALASTSSAPTTPAVPSASSLASSQTAKCLVVNAYINNKFARIRVYIDFGSVDSSAADSQFKHDHAVFPRALNAERSRYGNLQGRWEFELTCNELAWKLAWLNRARLKGRKPLIQKCLDAYRAKFPTPPWALLSCYSESMGSSVTPQFFSYWNPRPGRRRLDAAKSPMPPREPSTPIAGSEQHQMGEKPAAHAGSANSGDSRMSGGDTSVLATVEVDDLASSSPKPTAPAPAVTADPGATAAPSTIPGIASTALQPGTTRAGSSVASPKQNAKQATDVSPQPKLLSAASGDSAARVRVIRPKTASSHPMPASSPTASATANRSPLTRPQIRSPGHSVQRPASPATTAQQPKRQAAAKATTAPPSKALAANPQQLAGALNTAASVSAAPTRVATMAPPPVRTSSTPAPANKHPAPAATPSVHSEKSAKAQVAATMLTDVLRRLAKSDPSLAQLTGVLQKGSGAEPTKLPGASSTGNQSSEANGGDSNDSEDDDAPLDAKVAELEKLLIDLQKK
ncbi:hypothetical protein GQ54DRAFT_303669 [Martensiomyces pterosporus]|nr:hypothetical protein GQ54DRAFT_303669 [Martensiomyces pterosporus]